MIEAINSIVNVGPLVAPLRSGQLAVGPSVALYADNARGKSTLAAIIRSLATGDAAIVEALATLGGTRRPRIEIVVDGQPFVYEGSVWSGVCSAIKVFDSEFVRTNVYSGGEAGPQQREQLLDYALGEKGAPLKAAIDAVTDRTSELNRILREARKVIEPRCAPLPVEEFLRIPAVPPEPAERWSLEASLAVARAGAAVDARPGFTAIDLPDADKVAVDVVLRQSIHTLTTQAEAAVKDHVAQHLDSRGSEWLHRGVEYAAAGDCPFCGRELTGVPLVAAYAAYFCDEYEYIRRVVDESLESFQVAFSETSLQVLADALAGNREARAAWSDRTELDLPELPDGILQACREMRDQVVAALAEKAASPLEEASMGPSLEAAFRQYEQVGAAIETYNDELPAANRSLATVRMIVGEFDEHDLRDALHQLDLQALRVALTETCADYAAALREKDDLARERRTASLELDAYMQDLLHEFGDSINARLSELGADFSLGRLVRKDLSGTPRLEFHILLGDQAIGLRGRAAKPRFRTILSDSDKRVLALAFFLAQLDGQGGLESTTAVFDDPTTTFDTHRRARAQGCMVDLAERGCQVIVLSHDADLVESLGDDGFEQLLQLCGTADGSVFEDYAVD